MKAKLAILCDDFNCDYKPFMTFILVTAMRTNKSVHLIGHLPMGDNFT